MTLIAKSGIVSLASKLPPEQTRFGTGLIVGEDIQAGDACYVKTVDGLVYRSLGATAGADAARVDGFAAMDSKVAQSDAVTLFRDVDFRYGVGFFAGSLVGKRVYLSASVAGGLDSAVTVGGVGPIGVIIDDTRIRLTPSGY